MKEFKVSEEFIKEAHRVACKEWKERIEKEFPELFKVKWENGKWYKLSWNSYNAFANSDGSNIDGCTCGFGVGSDGNWYEKQLWSSRPSRLAKEEEIEEMLWKEANKRGLFEDTKIEAYLNQGEFEIMYDFNNDELWNRNGCIYEKGQWATPLDENKEIKETISRLEKELQELKDKLK